MQKQKAAPVGTAPACETSRCVKSTKIRTFKQRNKCNCEANSVAKSHRCTCRESARPSHIVGYWPHDLACDDGHPPMPPTLVTLLKEYRSKILRHTEESRLVSTVSLVDFLLFQDERAKGVAHEE